MGMGAGRAAEPMAPARAGAAAIHGATPVPTDIELYEAPCSEGCGSPDESRAGSIASPLDRARSYGVSEMPKAGSTTADSQAQPPATST